MLHSRVHIEVGDLVIVYMTRDNLTAITITPGEAFHNKYGRYSHDDMIGIKFGSKLHAPPPHHGYIHLLRPTPELWTLSLPHRTQILYMPDIAFITMKLGVRVGGKVLEAGTGSGSMTHSLSRAVGPRGRVLSYEYHETRYKAAKAEFEEHGLSNVELSHRNVCKDGFGDQHDVEAVFLDLPAPWDAIPHAMKVLRPDMTTKICCFSPCLEQVLKTAATLRAEGFSDISTQEVLVRSHELVQIHPGSSHLTRISSVVDRLKAHEKRKEARRIVQMRTAREKARKAKEAAQLSAESGTNGSAESPAGLDDAEKKHARAESPDEAPASKRPRNSPAIGVEDDVVRASAEAFANGDGTLEETEADIEPDPSHLSDIDPPETPSTWTEPDVTFSAVLTKPSSEMRGHTSYLTFASFHPAAVRLAVRDQNGVSREETPKVATRVKELLGETQRAGSQDTEYGDDSVDEALGTMTEEEMIAITGNAS